MDSIFINPGAGACKTGSWEQANENIKQYIEDCEIAMHVKSSEHIPDGGRYQFKLAADDFHFEIVVEMPGLPLDKVRYMGDDQNPFDFPRLYVDGGSWLWKFAIVKKENIREMLEERIEEKELEISQLKQQIEKLQEKY